MRGLQCTAMFGVMPFSDCYLRKIGASVSVCGTPVRVLYALLKLTSSNISRFKTVTEKSSHIGDVDLPEIDLTTRARTRARDRTSDAVHTRPHTICN